MLGLFDALIGTLYFLLIISLAWIYKNRKLAQGQSNYRFYISSLLTHLIGAVFFSLIYAFYYGGGDTFYYFKGGQSLINSFFIHPFSTIQVYFYELSQVPNELRHTIQFLGNEQSVEVFGMMKFTSIFCFFGFNNYLATTLLFASLSFIANWKLFKFVNAEFYRNNILSPKLWWILFVPSLIFWGTGVLKDTLVFSFLVFLLIYLIKLFSSHYPKLIWNSVIYIMIVIVSMYFVYVLKSYVLISFLLAILIAYYKKITAISKIESRNKILGIFFNFIFIGIITIGLFFAFQSFKSEIFKAESEAFTTLKGFHSWHTTLGGSSYDLGFTDYSIWTVIKKSPLAFAVTYFGPFPWELNSPVMLITALESYLFILLFIRGLYLYRWRLFQLVNRNNLIIFSMVFTIIFGVVVGISSYNYGALARFKIQAMPFFLIWVLGNENFRRNQNLLNK